MFNLSLKRGEKYLIEYGYLQQLILVELVNQILFGFLKVYKHDPLK